MPSTIFRPVRAWILLPTGDGRFFAQIRGRAPLPERRMTAAGSRARVLNTITDSAVRLGLPILDDPTVLASDEAAAA
jgi:hypothetical protein